MQILDYLYLGENPTERVKTLAYDLYMEYKKNVKEIYRYLLNIIKKYETIRNLQSDFRI